MLGPPQAAPCQRVSELTGQALRNRTPTSDGTAPLVPIAAAPPRNRSGDASRDGHRAAAADEQSLRHERSERRTYAAPLAAATTRGADGPHALKHRTTQVA